MIGAGTLIGIIIPVAYLNEVLKNNFHPMWLYYLATVFGGICGFIIGFRARILIAQLAIIGFIGFNVIVGIAFIFGKIFK